MVRSAFNCFGGADWHIRIWLKWNVVFCLWDLLTTRKIKNISSSILQKLPESYHRTEEFQSKGTVLPLQWCFTQSKAVSTCTCEENQQKPKKVSVGNKVNKVNIRRIKKKALSFCRQFKINVLAWVQINHLASVDLCQPAHTHTHTHTYRKTSMCSA